MRPFRCQGTPAACAALDLDRSGRSDSPEPSEAFGKKIVFKEEVKCRTPNGKTFTHGLQTRSSATWSRASARGCRPWNAEHAAGRITRPLRHNGQPYSGINVLSLWASAMAQNFAAPIWMTFRQATELNAHVRKGEKGSLVVYANSITRTEHDDENRRRHRPRNPVPQGLHRV